MRLTCRLFASLREKAGTDTLVLDLPAGATVAAAARVLEQQWPGLAAQLRLCRIAVNEEFTAPKSPLSEGDDLAVIPPVSGG